MLYASLLPNDSRDPSAHSVSEIASCGYALLYARHRAGLPAVAVERDARDERPCRGIREDFQGIGRLPVVVPREDLPIQTRAGERGTEMLTDERRLRGRGHEHARILWRRLRLVLHGQAVNRDPFRRVALDEPDEVVGIRGVRVGPQLAATNQAPVRLHPGGRRPRRRHDPDRGILRARGPQHRQDVRRGRERSRSSPAGGRCRRDRCRRTCRGSARSRTRRSAAAES